MGFAKNKPSLNPHRPLIERRITDNVWVVDGDALGVGDTVEAEEGVDVGVIRESDGVWVADAEGVCEGEPQSPHPTWQPAARLQKSSSEPQKPKRL